MMFSKDFSVNSGSGNDPGTTPFIDHGAGHPNAAGSGSITENFRR